MPFGRPISTLISSQTKGWRIPSEHGKLTHFPQIAIVLLTTFLIGCEMAYIFVAAIVKWPTLYREMAYKLFRAIVKWPIFYRVIGYILGLFTKCLQGVADSQPFNHVCYITSQTGLRPNVGDFFGD